MAEDPVQFEPVVTDEDLMLFSRFLSYCASKDVYLTWRSNGSSHQQSNLQAIDLLAKSLSHDIPYYDNLRE